MGRLIRLAWALVRAHCRRRLGPGDTSHVEFRIGPFEADLRYTNHASLVSIAEMGRIDLMVRTGFLRESLRRGWYLPLASISVQFRRPLRRLRRARLETRLAYWEDNWVWIEHRIVREGKLVAVAVARNGVFHGREPVPFESIARSLGLTLDPLPRPSYVDDLDRGERGFLAACERP